ncbi:MAG: serine/threonine protein kinase [Planctomycetes bacterium]|nr:serine/threonine protein kinase [Planctomycetota bacterium]
MNDQPSDPEPSPEDLAAEYLARLEDGESVDLGDLAARLPAERRAELYQLVGGVERVERVLPRSPMPGDAFHGRYQIVKQVGEGGMGRVYLARDRELGRSVALKVMTTIGSDASARAQLLLKESRLLAALRHPNIVAVHDSGIEGGLAWLVMDFVDGRSLADVLDRMRAETARSPSGRIAARDGEQWARAIDRSEAPGRTSLIDPRDWYRTAARIACEIARTLEAAHGAGVLHRDLKPANVMLTAGGEPVVLDFGLGGSEQVKVGDVTERLYGSLPYLAPEQVKAERIGLDPRTDVYQLGLVLYEMLALQRAFAGNVMGEVLERVKQGVLDRPSKHNPGVPRELEAICMLALEREPERRYATARALREDLEAYLGGVSMPVALRGDRARAVVRRARALGRRHPVVLGLAAVLVVALATWAAFAGDASLSLLEPFKLKVDPGMDPRLEALSEGESVAPGELLGLVSRSNRPRVLYVFSMFDTAAGERRLAPMHAQSLSEYLEEQAVGEDYGVEVEACADPESADCPRIVCSTVEGQNRAEGLFVLASEEARIDLETWMKRVAANGVGGVDLSSALALFPASPSVERGGDPAKARSALTSEQLRTLRRNLETSLEGRAFDAAFPGLSVLRIVCPVAQD